MDTVSPPYPHVSHPQIQSTSDRKYLKKILESSKRQNLDLPHVGNYLHSIYTVLGIISNLKIKYTGGHV